MLPSLALGALLATALHAQAAPPPASSPPPPPALETPSGWDARYEAARGALLGGQFAACASTLAELVALAPDPIRRARALDQASLCRIWAEGGFRLVPGSQPLDGAETREDRRTLDELAVLYTTSVLYGIGSGVVLAVWTEPSSPAGAIVPTLALASASAGAVYLLDRGTFRYGVPQSAVSGLLIGLEEGIAWTAWNQARVHFDDEWRARTVAAVWWGGATAGALAGGIMGSLYGTTPGRASMMGSGAFWTGLVAGLTAAALTSDEIRQDDYGWLAAAVALNVGALGGGYVGAQVSPSIARVRFLDLGGIAGGLLVGGLYFAIADKESRPRPAMTAIALGASGGLAAAWFLTRDMAPDLPRDPHHRVAGALVPLLAPTSGGALAGVGGTF
jgi:hypothetical protein